MVYLCGSRAPRVLKDPLELMAGANFMIFQHQKESSGPQISFPVAFNTNEWEGRGRGSKETEPAGGSRTKMEKPICR